MQTHPDHRPMSKARIAFIALGYALALTGALSLFRWLPFPVAIGIEVGGLILVTLSGFTDPRLVPLFRWRHVLIWLAGALAILSGLLSSGEENVHAWTPHPGGYQQLWLLLLAAFIHFRRIAHCWKHCHPRHHP
ncbi:MAG TPA: hypothetical protein VIM57_00675 [Luteolibacter sp.]